MCSAFAGHERKCEGEGLGVIPVGMLHSVRRTALWPRFLSSACHRRRSCVSMSAAATAPEPVFLHRLWLRHSSPELSSLRVATWNVLAQCYTRSSWFPWSRPTALRQKPRFAALRRDILALDAALLCLQEVDEYDTFWRDELSSLGYQSQWKQRTQRTNPKRDGVLVAWKPSVLTLVEHEEVDHNDLADGVLEQTQRERIERDCVALLSLFRLESTGRRVCVGTTHIYWDPALEDVKDAQVAHLLRRMGAFRARHGCGDAALILAGDFNSTPSSRAHQVLLNSGQAEQSLPPLRNVFDEEPAYTNVTPPFTATIDYLVVSPGVRVDAVLLVPPREQLGEGLPDALRPSDHLPLVAELGLT